MTRLLCGRVFGACTASDPTWSAPQSSMPQWRGECPWRCKRAWLLPGSATCAPVAPQRALRNVRSWEIINSRPEGVALDVGAAAGGLEHLVQKALGRLEHCRRGLRVGELLGTSEAGAPEEVALHEVGIGCGEAGTRGD